MGRQQPVVEVRATVEVDASDARLWVAQVPVSDKRFGGLFAWGASFAEARVALAETVLIALEGLGGAPGTEAGAIRIFAMTRKTFSAGSLKARAR